MTFRNFDIAAAKTSSARGKIALLSYAILVVIGRMDASVDSIEKALAELAETKTSS